jgi:catechol-2,3-dioxygenase
VAITGFAELTLEAGDPEALARFYVEVLGLEQIAVEDDRIWLSAGEHARLGIWTPGRKEFGDRGGRHVHFALKAQPGTLDRLAGRVRKQFPLARGPVEHPGGDRSLYLEDPEGNVVEVWDFFEREEGREEGVEALA